MVYEVDMTHYWFIDICISQSPSSSCSLRFFSLNFQKRDMIFYFTRSVRKSSRFFPIRSVQGSDNSRWVGSKEPGIVSPRPRSSFSSFGDAWVTTRGLGSWLFYPPLLCVLERLAVAVAVAKVVGSPYIGQGTVSLCSRTPVVTSRERSAWSGGSVVVVMVGVGVSQGHIKHLGRTME